jgi:hypothetical protein
MNIRQKAGYTSVISKSDGSYCAQLGDYERIKREFMAGNAFIEFKSIYGHEIVLRGAQIEGVSKAPPQAIQLQNNDNIAENRERSLGFNQDEDE